MPFPSIPSPALLAGKELAEAYARGTALTGPGYAAKPLRDHYEAGVGGELGDWVFVESNFSCKCFTVELSPASLDPGFLLASSEIQQVIEQNWQGLLQALLVLKRQKVERSNKYGGELWGR